jgi:hypothetical protein
MIETVAPVQGDLIDRLTFSPGILALALLSWGSDDMQNNTLTVWCSKYPCPQAISAPFFVEPLNLHRRTSDWFFMSFQMLFQP